MEILRCGNRGISGIIEKKLMVHYHLGYALIFNNNLAARRQSLLKLHVI